MGNPLAPGPSRLPHTPTQTPTPTPDPPTAPPAPPPPPAGPADIPVAVAPGAFPPNPTLPAGAACHDPTNVLEIIAGCKSKARDHWGPTWNGSILKPHSAASQLIPQKSGATFPGGDYVHGNRTDGCWIKSFLVTETELNKNSVIDPLKCFWSHDPPPKGIVHRSLSMAGKHAMKDKNPRGAAALNFHKLNEKEGIYGFCKWDDANNIEPWTL